MHIPQKRRAGKHRIKCNNNAPDAPRNRFDCVAYTLP